VKLPIPPPTYSIAYKRLTMAEPLAEKEKAPDVPLEMETGKGSSQQGAVVKDNKPSKTCSIITTIVLVLITVAFIVIYLVIDDKVKSNFDELTEVTLFVHISTHT
jgi:hypothetical protein